MTHAHGPQRGAPRRTRLLLAAALAPFVLATAAGLVALWPDREPVELGGMAAPGDLVDATVTRVDRAACPGVSGEPPAGEPPGAEITCTTADVRLEQGPDAGDTVSLPEQVDTAGSRLDVGDRIVVARSPEAPPEFRYSYADRERRGTLALLAAAFCASVIVLGRWGGLRALAGLVVSGAVIVFFVLPALLEGSNPLAVALVGSSTVALVALFLTHGVNIRTATAVIGTLLSLAVVGILGSVFVVAAEFTGLATEEAAFLQITAGQIDLRGLLLAGIVIGALGVLDDVTVTQVSAVDELHRADPTLGRWALYRSAVRIGRDHIASTVNTLVLAYAGASLPLLLLFTQAGQELADVVNGEAVAVEAVRALVGSIGLVCSVPLTTALAALVSQASTGPGTTGAASGDPRDFRGRSEAAFWREG